MEHFSNEEKYDMNTCYVLARRNSRNAANRYLEMYPERRQPHETLFRRIEFNLKRYGSFKKPNRAARIVPPEVENLVLNEVRENPEVSTREIEANTHVPKTTAHRILKRQQYHPYKIYINQGLQEGDSERRLRFCNWYIQKCTEDNNFPFHVLWSDETSFTNNGVFNRHNVHWWAQENPRVSRQLRHQIRFSFNVWCGILGTRIIGPIIFHGNLTSERYFQLLNEQVENYLDNIPLNELPPMWFQQDGAPAHNANIITNYLNNVFNNQWIGNRGPILWPARSPDITPLDFFIWGYVKNMVYKDQYNNVEDLEAAVLRTFRQIPRCMLRNTLRSTLRRARVCVENNGELFEHLL